MITDSLLFRSMVDPITLRPFKLVDRGFTILNPIKYWDIPEVKIIEVSQGFGAPLQLSVHSFSPSALQEEGIPEPARYMFSHPYGIVNLDEAETSIREFSIRNLGAYVAEKIEESDSLTTLMFQMACHMQHKVPVSRSSLVSFSEQC
jgi:hypothetical protein